MDHRPDPVTSETVRDYIRSQFGLEIPGATVEVILRRFSKANILKKESGVYRITRELPDPQIARKQAAAERHIESVLHGLKRFSQGTINPIVEDDEAVIAISTFLAEFDIACLRAYLRGTAIPHIEDTHKTDIVLVSDYVRYLQQTDPERFNSFLILVQGHMLANALMCPDLQNAPRTYRNVTFYLDTPLLVRRLGAEGEMKQEAVRELITLLTHLGGKVAAFAHSREEVKGVLRGAANNLESPDARGPVVFEARKRRLKRSDLLLIIESIEDQFEEAGDCDRSYSWLR